MLSVIILAAGLGKRMNNPNIPKVMTSLNNKPLIYYVLNTANKLKPQKIVLVVGHHRELLIDYVNNEFKEDNIKFAIQYEQLGTGHATQCAEKEICFNASNINNNPNIHNILILSGDVPLLSHKTLNNFLDTHISKNSDISVLTAIADDPSGYGRIIRNKNNDFIAIVEEKDADKNIKLITEINSGIYCVKANLLFNLLKNVNNKNNQNEYYLTDIIDIGIKQNLNIIAIKTANFKEIQGINTREQLQEIEKSFLNNKS